MEIKNNSNKCVNTAKEEQHIYYFGEIKYIVRTFNKNVDPEAVFSRLKQIAVNHIDTEN